MQKIFLAEPRGFCGGVRRAIEILEKNLQKFGPPIFVNHQIVHNKFLVENFKKRGVIFSENLKKIPENSKIIFSAHGVSPIFREKCQQKNLQIFDATCPIVQQIHEKIKILIKKNFQIFYVGQKNHQEFRGISGISKNIFLIENEISARKILQKNFEKKIAVLTQTTLARPKTEKILKILRQIPDAKIENNICFSTQKRQKIVEKISKNVDFFLVIGSKNSSNSRRLAEIARENCPAILCENAAEIPLKIFTEKKIGISAGASVPEILVENVLQKFCEKNSKIKIEICKI